VPAEDLERISGYLGAEVVVTRQAPGELDGLLLAQADVDRDVGQLELPGRGW
jgi:hypothetical protein